MRFSDIINEEKRTLGGFTVTPVLKVPGATEELDELMAMPDVMGGLEEGYDDEREGEYDMEGDFIKNQIHTIVRVLTHLEKSIDDQDNLPEWVQMKMSQAQMMCVDIMNYLISRKEQEREDDLGIEGIHEDWQKVNRKDRTSGMSRKAVKAYRRENPGSKLQTAVTTKPSKLKKGSKAAKRRLSFCRRMRGMKKKLTSKKTSRDPNSRINKALRRWNCESIEQLVPIIEALKLDAPQKGWSRDEVQAYLNRIKTDTKTKQDRFKPIIHGSNVKALVKDDGKTEWDLDDLAIQITTPPKSILGTNAKMAKSKEEGAMTYDLTLPALSGLVVDEDTGEFVEITTCPGAGECQLYCYARKGGYVMFPNSSMSAARALNFLVNHPDEYMDMFDKEVKIAKDRTDKAGIKLLVRIHDAGDFFSKEYYNLAMDVARKNPDVKFYFYTKMGDIATDANAPDNVVKQFSPGARRGEVKKVELVKSRGDHVKNAVTLPKDMFRGLFVTDAKGKYVKDDKGRTQIKSQEEWDKFKRELASTYKIDPESIITYDQMVKTPEGDEPKWNVIVFPSGHGDLGATRKDVQNQFLMFH